MDPQQRLCDNCPNNDGDEFVYSMGMEVEDQVVYCKKCNVHMTIEKYEMRRDNMSGMPGTMPDEISENILRVEEYESPKCTNKTMPDDIGPEPPDMAAVVPMMGSLMGSMPCQNCGYYQLTRVVGGCDDAHIYHCVGCDTCSGVDDSFSVDDLRALIPILLTAWEDKKLRVAQCPGENCDNDNPEVFGFLQDGMDGRFKIICHVCDYEQFVESVDAELCEPEPEPHEDSLADGERHHSGIKNEREIPEAAGGQQTGYDSGTFTSTAGSSGGGPSASTAGSTGRAKISCLGDMKPGDHIAWHRGLGYWHHAIVVSTCVLRDAVKVIQYTGSAKEKDVDDAVVEAWVPIDWKKEDVYRYIYAQCLAPMQTIENARQRVGERMYNLLGNNCEHFASWAKTGTAFSSQVEDFTQFATNKAKTIGNIVRGKGPQYLGHLSRAGIKLPSRGHETVLVLAIDSLDNCQKNVTRHHQDMKAGNISRNEFKRVTIQSVSQSAGGVIGTAAGRFVGSLLVPVAGSVVGASLGNVIGEGLGRLLGRQGAKLVKGQ